MKRLISILCFTIGICCLIFFIFLSWQLAQTKNVSWQVKSIDVMKYSRDLSREKNKDTTFDATIDRQVKAIAETGATHIAIGTPYNAEFLPFLTRWVKVARKYHLHVWFRGNFAGWEGWFDYPPITRDEHRENVRQFIENNPDLFADGDIFSPCPECENGGPGDPRITGDIAGQRSFLIQEYTVARHAFQKIHKKVQANYFSMNADVAMLVMDPATTRALGGIVVIDHYVATPVQLATDIREVARYSQGKVVLGEFGAPIPDIHGQMSETEQASWLDNALQQLAALPEVIGLNYWVNTGGSTQLWDDKGNGRKAVSSIHKWYR